MKKSVIYLLILTMICSISLQSTAAVQPDPPAGNALIVVRSGVNDGPKKDITDILSAKGQGKYDLSAWVKLKESSSAKQEFRLVIQTTSDGKPNWFVTPFFVLNSTSYTLITSSINITWAGQLSDAFIYIDTQTNGSNVNSTFPFYFDACSLKLQSDASNTELLSNGQFDYDSIGDVPGWTVNGRPSISYSIPFVPVIQATKNSDGSITYKNGFVPATDSNIRYLGRWEKQADNSYNGYYESGLEFKFTGKTFILRLAGYCSQILVKIDDGTYVEYKNAPNSLVINNGTLPEGQHIARIYSGFQQVYPKIAGFIIDKNARSLKKNTNPTIEFVGDSITVGYIGAGHINSLRSSYGFKTGELLGFAHDTVSFAGSTLIPNGQDYDPIGMVNRYFLTGEKGSDVQSKAWTMSRFIPDYLVFNLGTNDIGSDSLFMETYISFLRKLRKSYPGTVIFLTTPFSGKYVTTIDIVAEALNYADDKKIVFIDSSKWITREQTFDGIHPLETGHDIIAQKLAKAIQDYIKNAGNQRSNPASVSSSTGSSSFSTGSKNSSIINSNDSVTGSSEITTSRSDSIISGSENDGSENDSVEAGSSSIESASVSTISEAEPKSGNAAPYIIVIGVVIILAATGLFIYLRKRK